MKQIIRNVSMQHIIVFALLLITALLIWFGAPLLVIANHHPLHEVGKRIILIFTLFFLAFFIRWLLTTPLPETSDQPDFKKKLSLLKNRFQGAIQFLKKTTVVRHGQTLALSKLPWYVMIGSHSTGKTTLLANATIKYTLTKQFKQEKITTSDHCDWWATKDLVMIDVPGFYLKEKENPLFQSFMQLIKKYRGNHGLNGIVVALPLPEIMKKENIQQKKQVVAETKRILSQLHSQFSDQIPVYFIITKCDLLPGFLEFFHECATEELAQAWGITLPTTKGNQNIYETFIARFNTLIKKLNTQLLAHLHSERNPNMRPAIKDFPLQLERLKEITANFIKALGIPNLLLHGVYLTSATQSTEENQPAQSHLMHSGSQQVIQLLKAPTMPSKAFFIRQVLLQGLLTSGNVIPTPKPEEKWKLKLTYAFAVSFFLASLVWLGRDFHHSIFLTYAIQNDLAQYQLSLQHQGKKSEHFLKTLPLLNSLKARADRSDTHLSKLTHFLSFYSDKSQKTATTVYAQALQKIILPEIKQTFENQLHAASNLDPVKVYAILKAYLMLNDPKHLQIEYVINTLEKITSHAFDKQTRQDLLVHFDHALHTVTQPLTLNKMLVVQTRNQLYNLSKLDLALVILKNINNNNTMVDSPKLDSSIFQTEANSSIPLLFTGTKISSVLSDEIPLAANQVFQGNWVLGTPDTLTGQATIQAFTEDLRAHYISHYVSLWENKLVKTKFVIPTTLTQADEMISSITSNTSPLLALLKEIQRNTAFSPVLKASSTLTALNNLLANAHNDQENTLYEIFITLRKLHFHLENILHASNVGEAVFEAAKNHIQNPNGDPISMIHLLARQNTEPMKSWLETIANQSWANILTETLDHIENQWQVSVLTIYRSQLQNHFPIDPNAHQEIDMQQFLNFAGKQGTLANFYDHFLKPFVIDGTDQWRQIDNQRLPFVSGALAQIQQALKIQNISKFALFSQGQKNPALQHFHLPESLIEHE